MRFHLEYTPPKSELELDHSHKIFMVGSCFAENIGNNLKENRFNTYINPNGILFNPLSIYNCLSALVDGEAINDKYILNRDDVFFSFLHHSSVHDPDKHSLLKKINSENKKASQFLKEANYLQITFGTAYVYRHLKLDAVVSNCHKQPGNTFEKQLLSIETIVETYAHLIKKLRGFNPSLKIIFTVSPVKHLKDGIIGNNLSKSTLLLSIDRLVNQFEHCSYFPAYELVTDDLRDYRFYKEDLSHPNEQAIHYVWEKFSDCYFPENTVLVNQHIQKLNLALNHRSLIKNSDEAIKLNNFIIRQKEEIKKLDSSIEL